MYTYNPQQRVVNTDLSYYTTPENLGIFHLFYDNYCNEDAYEDRLNWLKLIAEDLGELATRKIGGTTLYHAIVYDTFFELLAVVRRFGKPTQGLSNFYHNKYYDTHKATLSIWEKRIPGIKRILSDVAGNKRFTESELQEAIINQLVRNFFNHGSYMPRTIRKATDPRGLYASNYPGCALYIQFEDFEAQEDAEEAEEAKAKS